MRFVLFAMAAAMLLGATGAHAQTGPAEAQQAMARLLVMVGDWEGEASISAPEQSVMFMRESVTAELGGTALFIRGRGYATPDHAEPFVFEGLGIISYDAGAQRYEFRSYTSSRGASTAEGRFLDDGRFQWVRSAGGTLIRFTGAFSADAWHEIAEVSSDQGATWTRTAEVRMRPAP